MTVVDVHATSGREEYAECLREWASTTWAAWSAHHDTVRRWAAIAAGRPT